ncbi:MAG: nuclear transport factor 2 family protein [Janthinobacterium lividum]
MIICMARRAASAAAVLLLVMASGVSVEAASVPASTQTEITAAYSQINTAFGQHNLDQFMAFFTPDYKVIDEKGATYTKEQTRQQYADQLKQMRTMQSRYTVQNFTPVPTGVEVEMKLHTQGIGEKRVLFMRLKGSYTDDLWVHDLWVRTPQGWRIKSRKTLADKLVTHPG